MSTTIEWVSQPGTTPETWNPVTGCTKISEGCANCYAKRMARRLAGRYGYPEAPNHFNVTLHPDRLEQPLHWRKPRTVFVCSMGDLFHPGVPGDFILSVFEVIAQTPHTYQILTKRPQNFESCLPRLFYYRAPLSNVWLGVSVENQEAANERIPHLLETPAAVRFISFEPLLESVEHPALCRLDWVIVGGESGPGARPMHPDWARSVRDQCQEAGVPFFFKQWGAYSWKQELVDVGGIGSYQYQPIWVSEHVGKRRAGRLLDGREWNQFPEENDAKRHN